MVRPSEEHKFNGVMSAHLGFTPFVRVREVFGNDITPCTLSVATHKGRNRVLFGLSGATGALYHADACKEVMATGLKRHTRGDPSCYRYQFVIFHSTSADESLLVSRARVDSICMTRLFPGILSRIKIEVQ